jgi:hypothetical protein
MARAVTAKAGGLFLAGSPALSRNCNIINEQLTMNN